MIASSPALIAEIPLIDWRGPTFLAFYAVAYLIATAWTWQRIRTRNARYDVPAPPQPLTDPYEIALLAGGKTRVMEVLLLKMLKSESIAWDNQWASPRLVLSGRPIPPGLSLLERTFLDRISSAGANGWQVAAMQSGLNAEYEQLEARLAAKGLRPTTKEWQKSQGEGNPLIWVAILGGIKILVGLDRGRPVSFLVIAVLVTLLTRSILTKRAANRRGGLTPAGFAALEKVRLQHPQSTSSSAFDDRSPNLALWAIGPALFGVAAVAAASEFEEVSTWMMQNPRLGQPAPAGGDGGPSSGCSTGTYSSCSSSDSGGGSGCSSSSDSGGGSSCGSSGCGGCGGGGGD